MLESLTLFVRTVTYSFIGLSFFVRCSAKLPPTVRGFARERIFGTTFDTKPNAQIYEKVSIEALNPLSCKTYVIGSGNSSVTLSCVGLVALLHFCWALCGWENANVLPRTLDYFASFFLPASNLI